MMTFAIVNFFFPKKNIFLIQIWKLYLDETTLGFIQTHERVTKT